MSVSRGRHTGIPRLYLGESLVYHPDAQYKMGTPGQDVAVDYPWQRLDGHLSVRGVGGSDPSWAAITGLGNMYGYSFSPTAMNQLWVEFPIPHHYAPGTSLHLEIHWLNAAATPNTGVVRWGIEYTVAKSHSQEAFGAPTTVYVEEASSATRWTHQTSQMAAGDAITSTHLEPDSLVLLRIFRDADHVNDTCTDVVFLLGVNCHYQADRVGTPNRSPDFYA